MLFLDSKDFSGTFQDKFIHYDEEQQRPDVRGTNQGGSLCTCCFKEAQTFVQISAGKNINSYFLCAILYIK